jgi:hypothetical protein
MTVTFISSHVIFEIGMPLISIYPLYLYQVTGIPVKQKNNTYSVLLIEANLLAIDKTYQNYFTPTKNEITAYIQTPETL